MKRLLIVLTLALWSLTADALDPLLTQTNIPSTYPQYSTNGIYPKQTSKFNFASNGIPLASGQMATNAVPRLSTNTTGIWSPPLYIAFWDSFDLVLSGNAASNTSVSAFFFLYPTHDLVTFDSNDVIVIGPVSNITGTSNFLVHTNISAVMGPQNVAGYFLGCGVNNSNSITNVFAQVVVKDKLVYVVQP